MTDRNATGQVRLNLGCGSWGIEGFINVDILDIPAVDVRCDVRNLECFEDDYADLIFASHVLEHFPAQDTVSVLREWLRVLKPGGLLRVAVPDVDALIDSYLDHRDATGGSLAPWVGFIFGGHIDQYDVHHTGFNFTGLRGALGQAGFVDVQRYDETVGTEYIHPARDPFGVAFSLHVQARKPDRHARA